MLQRKVGLKRSPFKAKAAFKAPAKRKPMKSRGPKMTPTAAERRWMAAVADLGCVVCLKFHHVRTPCAVHHIVEGQRRLGHMFTIGLCDPGHHQNTPTPLKISRHPNKARFEKEYGTEYELLEYTKQLIGENP